MASISANNINAGTRGEVYKFLIETFEAPLQRPEEYKNMLEDIKNHKFQMVDQTRKRNSLILKILMVVLALIGTLTLTFGVLSSIAVGFFSMKWSIILLSVGGGSVLLMVITGLIFNKILKNYQQEKLETSQINTILKEQKDALATWLERHKDYTEKDWHSDRGPILYKQCQEFHDRIQIAQD